MSYLAYSHWTFRVSPEASAFDIPNLPAETNAAVSEDIMKLLKGFQSHTGEEDSDAGPSSEEAEEGLTEDDNDSDAEPEMFEDNDLYGESALKKKRTSSSGSVGGARGAAVTPRKSPGAAS
eukprot:12412941-Karenia_brevis.AAC.1